MRPLEPISHPARVGLGIGFFILFFSGWGLATLGGFVPKIFLADPVSMVQDGWRLLSQFGFGYEILITVWRVVGGFILAALVAVPLGILMGAYKPV